MASRAPLAFTVETGVVAALIPWSRLRFEEAGQETEVFWGAFPGATHVFRRVMLGMEAWMNDIRP